MRHKDKRLIVRHLDLIISSSTLSSVLPYPHPPLQGHGKIRALQTVLSMKPSASTADALFGLLLRFMAFNMFVDMPAVKELLHLSDLPLRVEPYQVHKLHMVRRV